MDAGRFQRSEPGSDPYIRSVSTIGRFIPVVPESPQSELIANGHLYSAAYCPVFFIRPPDSPWLAVRSKGASDPSTPINDLDPPGDVPLLSATRMEVRA